jgi:hypothetical protein
MTCSVTTGRVLYSIHSIEKSAILCEGRVNWMQKGVSSFCRAVSPACITVGLFESHLENGRRLLIHVNGRRYSDRTTPGSRNDSRSDLSDLSRWSESSFPCSILFQNHGALLPRRTQGRPKKITQEILDFNDTSTLQCARLSLADLALEVRSCFGVSTSFYQSVGCLEMEGASISK